MYYLINNDPDQRYDDVDDVLETCISTDYWTDDTEGFDEYLDDSDRVEVCGYEFNPSDVLKELNYDGYMNELRYWAENRAESEKEDCGYSLEHARNGESVFICGYDVYCYEEDDEDDEDGYADTDGDDRLVFEQLEKKIMEQQEAEALAAEKENAVGNDFLSVIGIQVI